MPYPSEFCFIKQLMYYLMALDVYYTLGIMIYIFLYNGTAAWETLLMLKKRARGLDALLELKTKYTRMF